MGFGVSKSRIIRVRWSVHPSVWGFGFGIHGSSLVSTDRCVFPETVPLIRVVEFRVWVIGFRI